MGSYVVGGYMVPHPPLIVPAVGRGQEKQIPDTIQAYDKIGKEIAVLRPETIVLISSHVTMYSDYIHIAPGSEASGNFGMFGAAEETMHVKYDTDLVAEICNVAKEENIPAGTIGEKTPELDHATMVPLTFVNRYYQNYRLVRIGISGLSYHTHIEFGKCIRRAIENLGRRTVVIASGDLSHHLKKSGPYGFSPQGPEYDKAIMEIMESGDFSKLVTVDEDFCRSAGECGHRTFLILSGILEGMDFIPERLSYEGPFGVGYGICAYRVQDIGQDPYVRLAQKSLEKYVKTGEKLEMPDDLPKEMLTQRAGVFVSLKINGILRGCIGTVTPYKNSIAEEIIDNAISAGVYDPRFPPVQKKELKLITYSVDVLGACEPIHSESELDVKKYGVVVSAGYRRGLLLPNLEGVNTVAEQISIARQKAGIHESEHVRLERFEVVRHI